MLMLSVFEERVPADLVVPQQMPALPPAREFLTSAGFGGAAALLAAVILAMVAVFVARRAWQRHQQQLDQQQRHHREIRDAERRDAAINRIWQRLVWVVETAGVEPAASENAALGLGPELALELVRGLLREAEQLEDDTLARAASVYLDQFALVLAQQSGSLSTLAAGPPSATPGPDSAPSATPTAPTAAEAPPAEEPAASPQPAGGRRRRDR
jgi:hypothetical protein